MQAQPTASHFVNGQYVEDAAGAAMPVIFPGTGETIAQLHEATPAVIEAALAAAKAAQGPWASLLASSASRVPASRRRNMLRPATANCPSLSADHAQPRFFPESLVAEHLCRAPRYSRSRGHGSRRTHITAGELGLYVRIPRRLLSASGAWNYPRTVAAWKARHRAL